MWDIDRTGFALLFAGQVMSGVAFALLTMTAGAAAPSVDEDQARGQEGGFGVKLFEPGQEMAPDEGGMFRNFHGSWREETGRRWALRICIITYPI